MIEYVAKELQNKVYQLQKMLDKAEIIIKELKTENAKLVDQQHTTIVENEPADYCC